MLASRLPGLPPLSNQEALESAAILSLLIAIMPQNSGAEAVSQSTSQRFSRGHGGGGSIPIPGEISLAHNGAVSG
jgi:magnesium chelatase family protein